jgi:preprotein translocase subunit SecE
MARGRGASNAPGRVGAEATRKAFSTRYVGEVISELRRVTWPTRHETTRLTIMVVAVSAVIGVFLGVIDIGFSRLLNVLLGN